MGERNKHGLGRNIPASVKREVRKRCGYGCVRCGLGFYDYEHFDPDFKDALSHQAAGITLLCMQCNQKKARGQLAAETVVRANAEPHCLQNGFAREEWGFGQDPIVVAFAGVTFTDVQVLIEVNGYTLFSVLPPEDDGQFYRLSGLFSDETGQTTLRIHDNEWFAGADNWDVECVGKRIIIRSGPKNVSLVLRSEPPRKIVIEQLNMAYDGFFFRGREDILEISSDGISWSKLQQVSMVSCYGGISLRNR